MLFHMSGRYSPGYFFLPWFLLCAAGVAPAQQSPNDVTPRERTLLASSYTAERLWVWQKRLNLQDWNVSIVMARATELKPKTLGNIHWDIDKKAAVIRVLDPADYRMAYKEMLQDMEFTVVHELIHLNFAPVVSDFQRSDANRREEEHAVNHMADALLKLERSQQ
jgi:hypothetical protein